MTTDYANRKPLSLRAKLLPPLIRLSLGRAFSLPMPAEQRRRTLNRSGLMLKPLQASGARVHTASIGGRPGLEIRPQKNGNGRRLLYFHGGGYVLGRPQLYASLGRRLAALTGATVLMPDYRLAPEHPFPAAVDDALAAYRELLDAGVPANQIILAGDSAGGGLSLACALAARDAGLPQPAAIMAFSPWVDLSISGDSIKTCAKSELILSEAEAVSFVDSYVGDGDRRQPLASPLFADLRGLPPLLIQVTDTEILFDDSVRLAAAARQAGVDVKLEVWKGLWHVWQVMPIVLPEADHALAAAADFMSKV